MPEGQEELSKNPLLIREGLPAFDRIQPEHIVPAIQSLLKSSLKKVEDLEKNLDPTWSGTIEVLDEIGRPFEYAWGPVSHLFGVKNSDELREAYETVLGEMVAFGLRVKQSKPIYQALKQIRDGDEWDNLDPAQKRIIEQKILSTELAGIGLEGEKQKRFNEIAEKLSKLSTDFSNHVLDATKAFELILTDSDDVKGLPPSSLQLSAQSYNRVKKDADAEATAENGPWRITLDFPIFGPFMEHCQKSELREKIYRAFVTRASSGELDNSPIIREILILRREKAELLGFSTFAELSLAEKMAEDVASVEKMFEDLRSASWDSSVEDLEDIKKLASESGEDSELMNWDMGYWAERLREKRFNFTDEELRPYFALDRVLDGLFALVNRLFGIQVTSADGEAPVWNEDVRYFKIFNEEGNQIAAFYLDPYSRPENKRGGAWMDECLVRRKVGDEVQLPVAHLVCNSTPPVGEKPSLMTFREVETLFHEFGHGLQHMMTTVDYADASGINGVEWDAVELPSQFMENWCYHKPTLLGMTAHYETGEPLPEELFEKICKARTYRSGTQMLRQILFGMTDMYLHAQYDPESDKTVFEVQKEIAKKTSVISPIPEDRALCGFSHIFSGGYSAGYYSYKWAEVLSADAFSAFEDAGLDNEEAVRETGRRFRDTVLSEGGSRNPMEIFKDFRGREPNSEALLRHSGLIK